MESIHIHRQFRLLITWMIVKIIEYVQDSHEVVRQEYELTGMLLHQGFEYIFRSSIWPFFNCVLVYNIRIQVANVIESLLPTLLSLHPTRYKNSYK